VIHLESGRELSDGAGDTTRVDPDAVLLSSSTTAELRGSGMIQKKICMIGTSGVGKTSLVSRFVHSFFSDKYLTTVGVKIDKKTLLVDRMELTLMIWDLAGLDELSWQLNRSYFRGASGYLLVADGTRAGTLDLALEIHRDVVEAIGALPFVLLMNKADLRPQWEIGDDRIISLVTRGWMILRTSAKTGEGVELAFTALARLMTS
jgi:small GTP-binding protein